MEYLRLSKKEEKPIKFEQRMDILGKWNDVIYKKFRKFCRSDDFANCEIMEYGSEKFIFYLCQLSSDSEIQPTTWLFRNKIISNTPKTQDPEPKT